MAHVKFESRFESIMSNVFGGHGPNKEECVYLLEFDPHSMESIHMMSIANDICRKRTYNSGVIYAQIGIDVTPCRANCQFCSFARDHFTLEPRRMELNEITTHIRALSEAGDLYGVFLMTMHTFDMDYLLEAVTVTRAVLPPESQLWINVGDISLKEAQTLKNAGVEGAYHVLRLREGEDTSLDPKDRLKTFEAIKESGMQLFTCCEPIGPEHSSQEIVESVFLGFEYGSVQQSAMRRSAIPGLPISERGQISQLRLAQIVAVITLAAVSFPEVLAVGFHEPNLLGLVAGANIVGAEIGANPRDDVAETAENRGLSMNDCRRMLFEAGFTSIIKGDYTQIPLNVEYLQKVGAI